MVFSPLRVVAGFADSALAAVVSPALGMLSKQAEKLALKDPEYVRLMNEREEDAPLDFYNYSATRAIKDRFAFHPWWEGTAYTVIHHPVTRMMNRTEWAWQRLTRGWDDTALWSLDVYWAKVMAEQLTVMADITHGWPQGEEFPEFDDWTAALRENAALLEAYSNHFDVVGNEEAEKVMEGGQQAMRWIAEHLPSLWD